MKYMPRFDKAIYFSFLFNFVLSQFVIFKPLSYCFKETIGFDAKASSVSRLVSHLIS